MGRVGEERQGLAMVKVEVSVLVRAGYERRGLARAGEERRRLVC